MRSKQTVNVHQLPLAVAGGVKYRVVKTINTLAPRIGDVLSDIELQRMITLDKVTVNVTGEAK